MTLVSRLPRNLLLVLAISASLQVNKASAQQTIHVPAEQPTIQEGINAAADGDTVLVAPGTYAENIDFKGKAITVTSSGGPTNTVIDGSRGDAVVKFVSGETRTSVINGFTIKNGGASMYPNTDPSIYLHGIKVAYTAACPNCISNPTITNNIITHNYGYGIDIHFGGAYISGNTISYTRTQYDPRFDFGCDYDDGSAISVGGTPNDPTVTTVISNNLIEHNVTQCGGGGIRLYAAGAPTITNNVIRYNESKGEGGGIWMVNGNSMSIIQNLIYGNIAGTAGGGIYWSNSSENLFIVNNTIVGNALVGNSLIGTPFAGGSQIAIGGSVSGAQFFNNIVMAVGPSEAIVCDPHYQYLSTTPLVIDHSNIMSFSGELFGGWCTTPPTITNSMISLDPQFAITVNEPLRLGSGSPALDAGNNLAPNLPAMDLAGNPRIQGNAVDMGAYEGAVAESTSAPFDFALSSAAKSLKIAAGQYGTTILTISPVGKGFIGIVTFKCPELAANLGCFFDPAGVAIVGDETKRTTALNVIAYTATSEVRSDQPGLVGPLLVRGALAWGGFLLCCFFVSGDSRAIGYRRREATKTLTIILLLAAFGGLSCGGGTVVPGPPPPLPEPATYSYTVVVTATATGNTGSTSHTINVPVVVSR
jgi:hypothetical protein